MKSVLCGSAALIAAASLPALAAGSRPLVTTQPDPQADVAPFFVSDGDPRWSSPAWSADDIAALREKVKYVFVIYNENRSFDHEYGTLPGADGLYSDGKTPRSPADTPGFTQTYQDAAYRADGDGAAVPGRPQAERLVQGFHRPLAHRSRAEARRAGRRGEDGQVRRDRVAQIRARRRRAGREDGTQFARLAMAHIDCDTIPFFWRYATRFTIFDNNFATEDTPSTPNAVAMLAGQAGETQWVKHPSLTNQPAETGFAGAISGTINGVTYAGSATTQGPPLVNDPQPWWGSAFDDTALGRQPASPHEDWSPGNTASNMTFASLPLTMMGGWIHLFTQWDRNPGFDLPDVQKDIAAIAAHGDLPVAWRWYQNGYDLEQTDTGTRRLAQGLRQPPQRRAIFRLHRRQSGRADQPARRRRLLRRPRQGRSAGGRRGVLCARRLLQPELSETDRRHPEPELSQPEA